jgi:hypothetical protein
MSAATPQHLESVRLTPDEQAGRLGDLGTGYHDRYQQKGAEADLDAAIEQYLESVRLTPDDHPERAGRLGDLGAGYHNRYLRKGAEADLDAAIEQYLESVRLTPDDHPERARRLRDLGAGYHDRYLRKGAEADLDAAIQQLEEAFIHHSSPALEKLISGVRLTKLYARAESWLLAYQTVSTAVSLIPLLTPRSLATSDRQHILTQISGLASDAAAISLAAEKSPYEAIRLLELGRGIIAISLDEIRADIYDLQRKHSELAKDYINLRDQLDAPTALTHQANELDLLAEDTRQVDRRHNAGQKLEQMIGNIRKLPGFERFLLAPTESEIKGAAASGPVVVINVSDYRCDALILSENNFKALRLPDLHSKDIRYCCVGRMLRGSFWNI